MDTSLVSELGAITNLTHGFIYFSENATKAYSAIELEPTQQYFASRGAALGEVPAEVIIATFFNFNPNAVKRAIPSAWTVATAEKIQAVRMRAAGDQLGALAALDASDLAEATQLAGRVCATVGYEGRPLAGANRSIDEPSEPWARLWQRLTVIREWRGDAHVAALTASSVTAVEALALHAATGQVPKKILQRTRQWDDDAWTSAVERLQSRGLVEDDGSFTDAGRAFREDIEERTNEMSVPLMTAIGEASTRRLIDLLKPVRAALLESGAFGRLQSVG